MAKAKATTKKVVKKKSIKKEESKTVTVILSDGKEIQLVSK
jgi:hypothetical protein